MVNGRPLRIAFFGTPGFAARTLEALLQSVHQVVVVVTQPDRPRGRGQQVSASPVKALAERRAIPVMQPTRLRDEAWLDAVRALDLDLGVVAAYGRLLPEALLAIPRLGMINVHASLLPRYRGASPIHQAVLAGDTTTGVTIMRVVRELDAGAMLARVDTPIGPDETTGDVEARLADLGARLLVEVVDRLAAGPMHEEPQDDAAVTLAPRLEKQLGLIDWTRAAAAIHNLVRGLQPWPGAWSFVAGRRVAIRQTRLATEAWPAVVREPGTIATGAHGAVLVACGDGQALELLAVQPDGRRVMTAREFLAGQRPGVALTFGAGPA